MNYLIASLDVKQHRMLQLSLQNNKLGVMNMFKRSTKTNLACLAFSIAYLVSPSLANASKLDNFYAKAGIGFMKHLKFKESNLFIKKTPKSTPVYKIGIGYKFNNSIRADVDLRYSALTYKADDCTQKMHTTSLFVNGYYDANWHENITPYLTAGLGIGTNKAGDAKAADGFVWSKGKNSKQRFIWNVGAGMKFNFNKNYALDLGYKYVDLGKMRNACLYKGLEPKNQRIRGHQATAALIYSF
jgi:opacity protein-like surface antigen